MTQWAGMFPTSAYGLPAHVSDASLLRLFAIDELSAHYKRIIYMDIDMFIRWGDVSDLMSIDLCGATVGAVRDRGLWSKFPDRWMTRTYMPDLLADDNRRYFNAGFLLVDADRWTQQDITRKTIAFLDEHPEKCRYGDQSALNAILQGDWAELSPGWNWQINGRSDFLIQTRDPRIVHFTGPRKPWRDDMRLLDEVYRAMMWSWRREVGLESGKYGFGVPQFDMSKDRRRSRMLAEVNNDHLMVRENLKDYLNSSNFLDMRSGITSLALDDQISPAR